MLTDLFNLNYFEMEVSILVDAESTGASMVSFCKGINAKSVEYVKVVLMAVELQFETEKRSKRSENPI